MFNFLKHKHEEIKLCKDCKWMIKEKYDYLEEFAECGNPKVTGFSSVTGKIDSYSCSVARKYDSCGKNARYFEAKYE
jgi:hypothetical protein